MYQHPGAFGRELCDGLTLLLADRLAVIRPATGEEPRTMGLRWQGTQAAVLSWSVVKPFLLALKKGTSILRAVLGL